MWLTLAGLIGGLVGCAGPAPARTPPTAEELVAQISLAISAGTPDLVATGAFADFGLEQGVRLVTVRIVDRLQLNVRLESGTDVVFADPPRLCLIGPDSAPDDAGLQDPCWGSPDLSASVAERMPSSPGGQPMLEAGQPLDVSVELERGDVRCDYPPGQWTLELDGRPLVDGQAPTHSVYAPSVQFSVALPASETPLPYLRTDQTRYCGLATRVYQEQGEPATAAP